MNYLLFTITVFAILQSIFTLYSMIFAWDSEETLNKSKPNLEFLAPKLSFTLLIPAWKEEKVIENTITTISKIKYPQHLTQILILLRPQDTETVAISEQTIAKLKKSNISIILVNDTPRNKPNQLNWGLKHATGQIVTIFDAEDEPSLDILNIMNTQFLENDYDIVQNGVQLMNYNSNWFSMLNVLEYYFWFKSTLNLFVKLKVLPLGGNSLFIKKDILVANNGWDQDCLTEDCELGIRIANQNYKLGIVYDSNHTTQEETPHSLDQFIKQRTRWTQGFIQIIKNKDWLETGSLTKILAAIYILFWPIIQAFFFLYLLFAILIIPFIQIPLWLSIFSTIPFILLVIQIIFLNIGLYYFIKEYKLKYSPLLIPKLLITFIPYQLVLTYSHFRALYREITSNNEWEKTTHLNNHRATIQS
jgi:glycosyltransferase XagB